jgi:SAM-dependent methyltransferase
LNPIDFHSSASAENLQRDMIAALRSNRLDPKGLYATPTQAELWRQVSLHHAPIHRNPEFGRIYEEAFAAVAERLGQTQAVELIGLGCGTGQKEEKLFQRMKSREVCFMGVDISAALVQEAVERLVAAGATHRRSLVCDLGDVEGWAGWLDRQTGAAPRLITFFGLVPNLPPSRLGPILRALLRPFGLRSSDMLLLSVHLAPVGDGVDVSSAMSGLLPQYDNRETLAWLMEALRTWKLEEKVDLPEMTIGEVEGIPAFVGRVRWKESSSESRPQPLELFFSLRYTAAMFEAFLKREHFRAERLAVTACGEEGIWLVESNT